MSAAKPVESPRMRASFVFREVRDSFRAHLGPAVAVAVTTTLALLMLGGVLIARAQVEQLKDSWYGTTHVAAYVSQEATAEQAAAIGAALDSNPIVEEALFESQEQAYENFREQFADSAELLAEVSQDQLPRSWRVKLYEPDRGAELVEALAVMPGVRQVVDEHAQLSDLFAILEGMQRAAMVLAMLQTLVAVVLISNMLRSQVVARGREMQIGRAMGATRMQLMAPFVVEVAVLGLAGVAGATSLLFASVTALLAGPLSSSQALEALVSTLHPGDVWATAPALLAVGVVVPSCASALLLRRSLQR